MSRYYNCLFDLLQSFVYLNQKDSTIIQSVSYYGRRNFVGKRITGYKSSNAILTKKAAFELKNVQEDIRKDDYSLVVYDGY